MRKLTTPEFIANARKFHGDKYDYSLVEYINNKVKVKIICPIHGEFNQTPNAHLRQGCFMCGEDARMADKRAIADECGRKFEAKARAIYGDLYDYSLVEYYNCRTKVKIVHPKYGVFEQTPSSHLSGVGHPKKLEQ